MQIDVEGCEQEVLQGMDERCWRITQQLVVEVHAVGDRVAFVRAELCARGFRVAVRPVEVTGVVLLYARRA